MPAEKLTQQINVRVSEQIYARLEALARREWRSLGQVARVLMESALERAETEGLRGQASKESVRSSEIGRPVEIDRQAYDTHHPSSRNKKSKTG